MTKVTRIDGHGCDSGCYNYCVDPSHNHIFCRGTKSYEGKDSMAGVIIYTYQCVNGNGKVPPWCPLNRGNKQ